MNISYLSSHGAGFTARPARLSAPHDSVQLAILLALGIMLGTGCTEVVDLPPEPGFCGVSAPLTLGDIDVSDAGPTPIEVVRTGDHFVVGFQRGSMYELRSINAEGEVEMSSVALEEPDARFHPQLIRTDEGLSLFYEAGDAVHRVILSDDLSPGPVEEFWVMTPGSPYSYTWRAIADEDGLVRVVSAAYVVGYNGTSYVRVLPLGHGQWQIRGDDPSPFAMDPIDPAWAGLAGGVTGGASLASTPETGRHAGVFADYASQLIIAVEGSEPITIQMDQRKLQASMAWDGNAYPIVFTAEDTAGQRNLRLMHVSPEGLPLTSLAERVEVTNQPADDHSPVIRPAGVDDYGIAWVRDDQVMFQRRASDCDD